MVRAGSVLDFSVRGSTTYALIYTEVQLRADAIEALSRTLDVVDVRVDAQGSVYTGSLPFGYVATVRVQPRSDYGSAADVGRIVANAFYQAVGVLPTVTLQSTAGDVQPLPGGFDFSLPSVPITTTVALAAVALLVLAWRFR